MAMTPLKCPHCGERHWTRQPCPAGGGPRTVDVTERREVARAAVAPKVAEVVPSSAPVVRREVEVEEEAVMAVRGPRGAVKGEGILVRLQPDLLDRLDRYRGEGVSRPEAIRRVLEKELPR